MFQAHVRHVDVIHESHSQLSSRPRRRTQTSPQPHTVRTHVTRRIPIHQMANSHQTVIAPEENHLCQFRCSGANNITIPCMVWELDTPVQHLRLTKVSAPQRAIFNITSPARLVWHDESWRIALCSPISYLSHHILVIINSSLIASKC
jgi:hypothetical protein